MRTRQTTLLLTLTFLLSSFTELVQAQSPTAKPGQSFKAGNGMEMVWVAPINGWVAKYPVTQDEYQNVRGSNPSHFIGPRKPVENVSWEHAMAYCKKLNEQDHASGLLPSNYQYSLPTSAQYDFFVADASLDDAVTSKTTKRTSTEDVGSLSPNKYGLYDTRGNVREWCFEWADNKKDKMLLGGSWTKSKPEVLETSYRRGDAPSYHNYDIGFRCVVVPAP